MCTLRVSLRGITGPTDAINYATASRAQLRRRLVLIISPFGGPLEIFANSRPAGDTMEILRCRPARYDRSRGKEGVTSRELPEGGFVPLIPGTIGTRSRGTLLAREAATIRRGRFKKVLPRGPLAFIATASPCDKCWLICNRIIEYFTLLLFFRLLHSPFFRRDSSRDKHLFVSFHFKVFLLYLTREEKGIFVGGIEGGEIVVLSTFLFPFDR